MGRLTPMGNDSYLQIGVKKVGTDVDNISLRFPILIFILISGTAEAAQYASGGGTHDCLLSPPIRPPYCLAHTIEYDRDYDLLTFDLRFVEIYFRFLYVLRDVAHGRPSLLLSFGDLRKIGPAWTSFWERHLRNIYLEIEMCAR